MIIPNMWENKANLPVATNQEYIYLQKLCDVWKHENEYVLYMEHLGHDIFKIHPLPVVASRQLGP